MEGNMLGNKRKIPGMLYIPVSFVPWIIYWVLCGMGNKLGVFFSFAISFALAIPQIRRRDFYLMDLASILYFTAASIGTFIFNLNVFVEYSGFIGYLVLFLMAIISIAIKQPFTFKVSKKDWPEAYWKEKSFLLVNNIISAVWAIIFIANAFISLLLVMPFKVILSNILNAFGIVFSIIFPMKAPAYFVAKEYAKEFKKYDWKVGVDPRKPREENEYDVIIVGSGIGGLTCGALLSKRGYKVMVLEQHYQVGGYCSSFRRNGFTFNTGVENVSGLWEKGPITFLLKELGLEREKLFVKNTVRHIFKGKDIEAESLEGFTEVLSAMFPDEKGEIQAFFEDARMAYEECYRNSSVYGTPLPAELMEAELMEYPRERPHFFDWMNKTFKQKLDEYFKSEDLKTLICALLGHIGTELDKTPASGALTACVSYYLHGGYFPKGGAQRFADRLREVIENHGGKILVKHKVDRILVEGGEAKGVKVGDKTFRSSAVVANANAKTTFFELVGKENLDGEFVDYVKGLKMSPSCFMVFLGVGMDLSSYPTLIKNLDEGYGIVINSNADLSLAPERKASVTLLSFANYHNFPERGTEGYVKIKKEFAEKLIKKAEGVIPDLSKHIIVQDAATPKTFERYTSMPEGAIYSFDQSVEVKRPCFKTPIKGLYLAGASTFPGGGIEAVVISGMICANDICNWQIKAPWTNSPSFRTESNDIQP